MGSYSGGLIIGRIFAFEIWGTYFREGLIFFLGGEGVGGGLLSEFYGSIQTFFSFLHFSFNLFFVTMKCKLLSLFSFLYCVYCLLYTNAFGPFVNNHLNL